MSKDEAEGDRKIVVKDRRRFTAEGEMRPDAPPDTPRHDPPPTVNPPRPASPPGGKKDDRGDPRTAGKAPGEAGGMDFLSFAASLATNAMAALGLLPPEQARGMPQNPELGREYIEILAMLQEKTRGNLSAQEDATLQRILTELRLAYVEVTRR